MTAILERDVVWLTKQEAATYARVSVSTIERAIRAGELRAGGTPGRVLIRREWIDEWLEHRVRRADERSDGLGWDLH
jgi:excisionase family DNA binding protein